MKRLLGVLLLLAAPLLAQDVYPPEGNTTGLDNFASGIYNLCVETEQSAATTGTIEEVLASCTIPADSLGGTNDFAGFIAFVSWDAAANTNAKTVRIRVGGLTGTVVSVHTADATSGNQLQNSVEMYVDGSDSLIGKGTYTRTTGTTGVYASGPVSGLTFSSTIDIAFTGETATQAGDITLTSFRVAFISAYGYIPSSGWFWPLLAPDGGLATPQYSFVNRPQTGIWAGADSLELSNYDDVATAYSRLWLSDNDVYAAAVDTTVGGKNTLMQLRATDTTFIVRSAQSAGNANEFTIDSSGVTLSPSGTTTGQFLAPAGDAQGPAYSASADSTTGISVGADTISFGWNATAADDWNAAFQGSAVGSSGLVFAGYGVGWTNSTNDPRVTTPDILLIRSGTGILEQRAGTTPQILRMYSTYTDTSNYRRAVISTSGGSFKLTTESNGTGSPMPMIVGPDEAQYLYLQTDGTLRWDIVSTTGDLVPHADSTYNIGSAASAVATTFTDVLALEPTLFANLPGSAGNGSLVYCSDCTKATPCAGSGSGAIAKKLNGAWDCD
jgi:hypothetical protein